MLKASLFMLNRKIDPQNLPADYKKHILLRIFFSDLDRFIWRTILYSSVLLLISVLYIPLVAVCVEKETLICRVIIQNYEEVISFFTGYLRFTPGSILFFGIGVLVTYLLERLKNTSTPLRKTI